MCVALQLPSFDESRSVGPRDVDDASVASDDGSSLSESHDTGDMFHMSPSPAARGSSDSSCTSDSDTGSTDSDSDTDSDAGTVPIDSSLSSTLDTVVATQALSISSPKLSSASHHHSHHNRRDEQGKIVECSASRVCVSSRCPRQPFIQLSVASCNSRH